jgi:hypothetical protein
MNDTKVRMSNLDFPGTDVILSRLMRGHPEVLAANAAGAPLTETLPGLAESLGMRKLDLFIVAGLDIPDDELPFHTNASSTLPRLVNRALALDEPSRQRLRDAARSLSVLPPSEPCRQSPLHRPGGDPYPLGTGSLFARMIALRNMSSPAFAQALLKMSGVWLAVSCVDGMVRGLRVYDAKLVIGLAAVLGMPARVLATLMDVDFGIEDHEHSPENRDVAALLWEVRQLTAEQVAGLIDLAGQLEAPAKS